MESIIDRLDTLMAWIDRGSDDPEIALAMRSGVALESFRSILCNTRGCITEHSQNYDGAKLGLIGRYLTENMNIAEKTAFGRTLLCVHNDLNSMSYVLGALRKAYTLDQNGDYPQLPRVIAYLERIRQMMGDNWSWDVEGMAPLCDEFRHFVAEHLRDLYRKLGHDFHVLLAFSPSNDEHDMPRMYRP